MAQAKSKSSKQILQLQGPQGPGMGTKGAGQGQEQTRGLVSH